MKKIRFPRIRKGYGKLVSVLRRRGGRKRTEQLPEVLLEAERCENEQLAMKQHEAMQCEDERHEAVQCEAGGLRMNSVEMNSLRWNSMKMSGVK